MVPLPAPALDTPTPRPPTTTPGTPSDCLCTVGGDRRRWWLWHDGVFVTFGCPVHAPAPTDDVEVTEAAG